MARAGFEKRRSAIVKLLNGAELDDIELLDDQSDSDPNTETSSDRIALEPLTQRFLSLDIALTSYIDYMRSLLPSQYHDLILGYFFSSDFVRSPDALLTSLPPARRKRPSFSRPCA